MDGGSITNNSLRNDPSSLATNHLHGGGVFVLNANFTMNGGEISGNKTNFTAFYQNSSAGGGVFLRNNSVFMFNGGSIKDNLARNAGGSNARGGGVFSENSTIVMKKGASIAGNTAESANNQTATGGLLLDGGSLTMEGGSITGNKAVTTKNKFMGIYVVGGSINLKGAPEIQDISMIIDGNYKGITITGAYTGGPISLDLGYFTGTSYKSGTEWNNKKILKKGGGYSGSLPVSSFKLGKWYEIENNANSSIKGYFINDNGELKKR
jgi:hypothetical protein